MQDFFYFFCNFFSDIFLDFIIIIIPVKISGKERICPIEIKFTNKPMWKSGSRKFSIKILNAPYIIKNKPDSAPIFLEILVYLYNNIRIVKDNNPSKKASYSWLGCLGKPSVFGNITPKFEYVILPYSSRLIKLAILPRNKPVGAITEILSVNLK